MLTNALTSLANKHVDSRSKIGLVPLSVSVFPSQQTVSLNRSKKLLLLNSPSTFELVSFFGNPLVDGFRRETNMTIQNLSCSVTLAIKGTPFWGRPFSVGQPPKKKRGNRVPLN